MYIHVHVLCVLWLSPTLLSSEATCAWEHTYLHGREYTIRVLICLPFLVNCPPYRGTRNFHLNCLVMFSTLSVSKGLSFSYNKAPIGIQALFWNVTEQRSMTFSWASIAEAGDLIVIQHIPLLMDYIISSDEIWYYNVAHEIPLASCSMSMWQSWLHEYVHRWVHFNCTVQ